MKIHQRNIIIFEPTKRCGLRTGWKISKDKEKWENETKSFNDAIVKLAKINKKKAKKIDWAVIAKAMEVSHANQADSIRFQRGNARAIVVDMWKTFGHYFN